MRKKTLAILTALSIFSLSIVSNINTMTTYANEDVKEIVIYHTNDTHGSLMGDGEKVIGIDKVAALKEQTENSILVDAGDAIQGKPLASLTKGSDVIELMTLAGYDFMVAGNHEFDFGVDHLLTLLSNASFPMISANVYKDGKPLFEDSKGSNGENIIIEKDGVKVGFFGLTTSDTKNIVSPAGIKGVEFKDELEVAKNQIDELESKGADVIIAVTHVGDSDVPYTSADLANGLTGEYQDKVDVIIDAHSHSIINEEQNGVLIMQTGTALANVGKITLKVQGDKVDAQGELLNIEDMKDVQPKKEVTEKLKEIELSQQDILNEKVGYIDSTLWTKGIETNLGDFISDAFINTGREYIENYKPEDSDLPIVAVQNSGGIRQTISNGVVTMGDIMSVLPFSNSVEMKKITPKILYDMMELSGKGFTDQNKETGMLPSIRIGGGSLQVGGFTVTYNPVGEEGSKVTSIVLDGQDTPLDRNDDETEIMLVTNGYIMAGGNEYAMLVDLPLYVNLGEEVDSVINYINLVSENGTIKGYERVDDRIQIRMPNGYVPKEYVASVQVLDKEGNPIKSQEVSYRVDGGQRQSSTTDENGILKVTLSDGSHSFRLGDSQEDIYLDNYAGLGIVPNEEGAYPYVKQESKSVSIDDYKGMINLRVKEAFDKIRLGA